MKHKFFFLGNAILLVSVTVIILLFLPNEDKKVRINLLSKLNKAEEFARAGKAKQVEELLQTIDESEISKPDLLLRLYRIKLLSGDMIGSRKIAERAWANGSRNSKTVNLLLASCENRNKLDLYIYISRFLDELPENRANDTFKADVYQDLGHSVEARKIWSRYFNDKHVPSVNRSEYAVKIARSLILENKVQPALEIFQTARKNECMSLAAYNLQISLYLIGDENSRAVKLFDEATQKYTSPELNLKKALASIYLGDLDAAEKQLEELRSPSTASISTLAANYNARMYLALLRTMKNGRHAFFSDLINDSMESSRFLNGNSGKSKLLKLSLTPETLKKEVVFYKTLARTLAQKGDSLKLFKAETDDFPTHPVVDYLVLKAALVDESDVSAVAKTNRFISTNKTSLLEGLHGLFIMSPFCVSEMSQVLYSLGAYKQADKLMASLRNRRKFSSKEINMLLKLAVKTNDEKLLNALLKMKNINQAVDFQLLQELAGKPRLQAQLCGNNIFKVIFLANSGDKPEALRLCDRLSLPEKKNKLLKARIFAQNNDDEKAEKLFRQVMDSRDDFWGYREYAAFLVQRKRMGEAQKLYREILKAKPNDLASVIGTANILDSKGETEKAVAFLNEKITLERPEIFMKLSQLTLKLNDFSLALRYANKALGALGRNDEALFYKTVALIGIYKQYSTDQNKKAVAGISKYLEHALHNDKNILILTAYIESLFALKSYAALLDVIETEKLSCDSWLLNKQILSLIYTGKSIKAERLLYSQQKSLDEAFILFAKAEILAVRKDYTGAMNLLRNSTNRRLRYKAAEFAVRAHDRINAERIMKSVSPTFIDWGGLATAAEAVGDAKFAFKCYDEALKLAPENPLILNNYAWLAAQKGGVDKNKMIGMIRTAYSKTPTRGILDTYFSVLERCREYEKCQTLVNEHHLLTSMDPQLTHRYMVIMKKGGRTNEVLSVMDDILRRDANFWKHFPESKDKIRAEYIKLKTKRSES